MVYKQIVAHAGNPLAVTMADLGLQPASNAYLPPDQVGSEKRYPLRAKVCGTCMLVQIDYDVPPEELFSNYAYFSSFSDSWLAHAVKFSAMAIDRFGLDSNSLVVELASNDGYLLKNFVKKGIPVLGIDPSDTVAAAAEKIGVPTLVEFFGVAVATRLAAEGKQADLIAANNVMAHVPALNDFVGGINILLKPQGTLTVEFPHLLKLVEHVEFDTIYHEHFSYISLIALEQVFKNHGLAIYDVEELPTHGGSLRIFATHQEVGRAEAPGLLKVRADEKAAGLDRLSTYEDFNRKVEECRRTVLAFLADKPNIVAYGAAAKGNTLMNYCGITPEQIRFVADRNPHKQGKLLPGTHIPVVSPDALLAEKPDYVLILPWNLKKEIVQQLAEIRGWGGKFVTPVPVLKVVE